MQINKYNGILIVIPILFDNILRLLLQDHNRVSFASAFISSGVYKPFNRWAYQTERKPDRNGSVGTQRLSQYFYCNWTLAFVRTCSLLRRTSLAFIRSSEEPLAHE